MSGCKTGHKTGIRYAREEIMNIFVGSLAREVTDEDLLELFAAFGDVTSATVVKDKFSGQSRGFGFVEMSPKAAAIAAIAGLNGKEVQGRTLTVNEARPRTDNRDSGRRRTNGGGGGGARRGQRR
jgi:RNA recognition motif-containing protein